jgi:7,8-dihydropterin-6-yl-methyl-4-(beta-D-ribofuranosyl)aminobenzene 5'-phosphate synthase
MLSSTSVTLTLLYDNHPFDVKLKTAWGFACLVETGKATVLFDTGGDGPTLMANMTALGIDPRRIDAVVLSHIHDDHTGGLEALLSANDRLTVYLPRSFPTEFKARIRNPVVEVHEPMAIADHIHTLGELGTAIIEQSLIVETDKGLIVLTGCAHPGVVEIVRRAEEYGEVYLVMGGLHLKDKSAGEIGAVITELKQLGVQKIAPCHCTGEQAIRLFEAAFGPDFIRAGAGLRLLIQK